MALLRHLALRCQDMEKSRTFYEQAIGWKLIGYRSSGRALDMTDGTSNITLIQQPNDCKRPTLEEGNEYVHFGVIVDDLEACWNKLNELGAELATDRIKQGDATNTETLPELSFKALDPDGNVIDVTCNKEEWLGVSI